MLSYLIRPSVEGLYLDLYLYIQVDSFGAPEFKGQIHMPGTIASLLCLARETRIRIISVLRKN